MAEYINKAELKQAVRDKWKDLETRVEVNCIVNEMPTIEIVHCSECIHAKLNRADGEYYCEILQYDFVKDYYCVDGERRSDG